MYRKVISCCFYVVLDAWMFLLCYISALPFCSVFSHKPIPKALISASAVPTYMWRWVKSSPGFTYLAESASGSWVLSTAPVQVDGSETVSLWHPVPGEIRAAFTTVSIRYWVLCQGHAIKAFTLLGTGVEWFYLSAASLPMHSQKLTVLFRRKIPSVTGLILRSTSVYPQS